MKTAETIPSIAAIVHAGKGAADVTILQFVQQLEKQGKVVRGLLPGLLDNSGGSTSRALRDLEDGTIYPIFQNLGPESQACCLDPGALLAAGTVLRRARQEYADLVVVNRFGALEADGRGFCTDMLDLIAEGYPVLTIVSESYLDAWRRFTGGLATELSADSSQLYNWFEQTRYTGQHQRPNPGHQPSRSSTAKNE